MSHVRACPKCRKIVEWTRGKKVPATMPDGSVTMVTPMSLSCPEHGPFDNVKAKMNESWERVERGMRKSRNPIKETFKCFQDYPKIKEIEGETMDD